MALISTLQDDFNAGTINSSLWLAQTTSGASITETGGVLRAILPAFTFGSAQYAGVSSQSAYDFTGSRVYIKIPFTSRTNGIQTYFGIVDDTTGYEMKITQDDSSTITFNDNNYHTGMYDTSTATYNSTTDAWWQIRQSGSSVYFETSPDGETWSIRMISDINGGITTCRVYLYLQSQSTSVPTSTEAKFDNVNTGSGQRTIIETASGGGTTSLLSESASQSITETVSGGGLASYSTVYQPLPQKEYEYRVYDHLWNYIGVWANVTSHFSYEQTINQNAQELNVTIGRSPDNRAIKYDTLLDESSSPILDENSDPIRVQTTTANSVGDSTDVDLNYNVEVYVFYGGYDALLDENLDPILDESHSPILSQYGAPNGLRVYAGYVADYDLKFGDTTGLDVVIVPHATEQNHYVFKNGSATTVSYSSVDPVRMARDAMDNYTSQGGYITYSPATMPLSGTVSDYPFKLQTTREAIDKVIDLLPTGWCQYVHPGENLQYMFPKSSTANHTFYYEQHLSNLDLRKSITQLVNQVYYTGGDIGGGVSLYNYYEDTTSISTYRRGLERLSDARVTLDSSANIISNSHIASYKDPRYRTSITISDAKYDIETIKLGQMVAFQNFGNFVDTLLLQIVTVHRAEHTIILDLDMVVDSDSKRLQDIYRQLRSQDAASIPSTP